MSWDFDFDEMDAVNTLFDFPFDGDDLFVEAAGNYPDYVINFDR